MRIILLLCLSLVGLWAFYRPFAKTADAHAIRGSIDVDGRVDDFWRTVEPFSANNFVEALDNIDEENRPTASIRCLWDDEQLFVLADIRDSVICTRNGNSWEQDSIEIFIDEDHSRSNALGVGDYQFRVSAIGEISIGADAKTEQITAVVVPMTGGYRVEAAVKISSSVLQPDSKIGIEFQINNDPGTGRRESITKWHHKANDAWKSTANYGTLHLQPKPSTASPNKLKDPNLLTAHSISYSEPLDVRSNSVPEWAADAVFYQLFPERFRNGDPSNDPTRESLEFPDVVGANWKVTPWTSQWYKRADWEQSMGDDFYDDGVFHRRFGGDLQGVIDKLDYLADLGINAIYFNPVFYARSLHKYDGNSFHHIDPYFGPDPLGDLQIIETETAEPSTWQWTAADRLFLKLIKRAKSKNIRVIIDGVFNHTGRDFFAFKDLAKRQSKSPYGDWYLVDQFDDPATSTNEFKYKGWWGVDTLPEFADNEAGDDLHPAPKAYVMQATARWMDPNGDSDPEDGIDGWRLDVANEVPNKFWRHWNKHVRKINPQAYTVAEIWDNAGDYLTDCGFSATMNYHGFAYPVKGFLIDGRLNASEFGSMIEQRMNEHDPAVRFALQNLLDSHDTDRVSSMIVNSRHHREYMNAARFDYDVGERASPRNGRYDVSAPNQNDKSLLRIVAMFQMTFVGAPMVYYGTECGMDGADDPDDRMPMVWDDLKYETRTLGPNGKLDQEFSIQFDRELHQYYQRLIAIRKKYSALRRGTFSVVQTDNDVGLFVFFREYGEEKMLVAINRGEQDAQLTLKNIGLDNQVSLTRLLESSGDEKVVINARPLHVDSNTIINVKRMTGQIWRIKK